MPPNQWYQDEAQLSPYKSESDLLFTRHLALCVERAGNNKSIWLKAEICGAEFLTVGA